MVANGSPSAPLVAQLLDGHEFTTTIHGYEGAGRGFSVRFRDRLAESDHEDRVAWRTEVVTEFVAEIAEQTERVNSRLEDATTSLDLVLATLSYEYSRLANGLRRFRSQYGEDFTEADRERIERMLALLQHFATAREYFKTLYLSREFAQLSKQLLYLSLPVILMSSFVLLHSSIIPETHDITTVLIILALSPFFLLAAFTVRVATVTIRTRAAGQFVIEE